MTETEIRLRELIAKICESPASLTESERRRLVDRLLITVQKLPGLVKSSHLDFLEALDKTYWWLSQNICQFNPPSNNSLSYEKGLTRWINGYLYRRIQDLYQQIPFSPFSLDQVINQGEEDNLTWLDQLPATPGLPTLNGLEIYIERLQKEKTQDVFLKFEFYVEQDFDKRLQNCHPRHFSNCNCQMLCQRILLQNPSEKISDISREFGVNYQTLKSHWEKKCKPLLREILVELGYCSE
ncbi:hypothetical protein [uncultured Nostoc sp.]|uniref:hypothetical protein n=1 Tax=uncultured Nostoc sp. TaxID=340711 RepID=UPI0035CC7AF7